MASTEDSKSIISLVSKGSSTRFSPGASLTNKYTSKTVKYSKFIDSEDYSSSSVINSPSVTSSLTFDTTKKRTNLQALKSLASYTRLSAEKSK